MEMVEAYVGDGVVATTDDGDHMGATTRDGVAATTEETCVRDKAAESLCRIGSQMRESDLVEYYIPLVKVS